LDLLTISVEFENTGLALLPDQLEDIRDAEVLEIAPERCSHR
jgi:hypothetical protein